ncbi:MAG: glycosyltransferase [Halioglobus sp.]|nr:glycosyltransferase [Halioglobus sp.]
MHANGTTKMNVSANTPPSEANTALVIVLFEPDSQFPLRLRVAAGQFPATFIIDNSEKFIFHRTNDIDESVHYHRVGHNGGLGKALNTGCQIALENGFEWAVTLDQDTLLEEYYLSNMLSAARSAPVNTALIGCNYFSESRRSLRYSRHAKGLLTKKTTVITSGCLTNLGIWQSVGKFREDYFIDSIDHEICLRMQCAGAAIMCNPLPLMSHTIGHKTCMPSAVSRLAPYRHSIPRKYTATRNTARTVLDYGGHYPLWCTKKMLGLAYEIGFTLLIEPEKRRRLNAYALGLRHGFSACLGPPPANLF